MSFIPASKEEIKSLKWDYIDIIIISGDAYVDHPSFGTAVIARVLEHSGYRVAIIDQPDVNKSDSICLFGKPRLFFAVSSGNVDSMLTRYTAFKKIRNDDPFSPDDIPKNRCDRAVIRYCNLIKQKYKDVPIVIGGIEASMRRMFHYDYWSNSIRRSILEDSRADVLVYGMGEKSIVEIARRIKNSNNLYNIPGTVVLQKELKNPNDDYLILDPENECIDEKEKFLSNFKQLYLNSFKIIAQPVKNNFLVSYPSKEMTQDQLDFIYTLPFERKPHPKYSDAKIPAFEMIKFSINSHRGCASGCSFCSIFLHQGKHIISRTSSSIISEAKILSKINYFKGHINDIGGPSANMYNSKCTSETDCSRPSCLFPSRCKYFKSSQKDWINILKKVSSVEKVKHVTIGSGLRYDLFMADNPELLEGLAEFISGRLKIAPEHTEEFVLKNMQKIPLYSLEKFYNDFSTVMKKKNKKYYIVPYFISNHPGSTFKSMKLLKNKIAKISKFMPEQVQSFIPLPMTISSVIYYSGKNPFTEEEVFSEKDLNMKRKQHNLFFEKKPGKRNGNFIK